MYKYAYDDKLPFEVWQEDIYEEYDRRKLAEFRFRFDAEDYLDLCRSKDKSRKSIYYIETK